MSTCSDLSDILMTHSGLDDVICSYRAPRNGSCILFTKDSDGLAIDNEFAILGFDRALETSVNGVVFEHVNLAESD